MAKIWALADPHLSLMRSKPMDVFGDNWRDHDEQITENWKAVVAAEDSVVMPGDISWAMTLREAWPDLVFLDALPGTKYIGRGNHDYWWTTLSRMENEARERGLESLRFLRNNAYVLPLGTEGRCWLAGSRGWLMPGDSEFGENDAKIWARELIRLELSLQEVKREPGEPLICALHFPPASTRAPENELTALLRRYGVDICIYGHLHGKANADRAPSGFQNGIRYINVAADQIDFCPLDLNPGNVISLPEV
ncbi:MAG: hypothetical protein GX907_00140 [Clostridiaceae bacterium]|nr:hypothetical protein [Clostridiaceae bacterium]